MSELQLLIRDQIICYETILNKLGPKNKSRAYYERNRKEALSDLIELQLKEFNHD